MNDPVVEDDILAEIRMKYAEDLEEILECPICLEIPLGKVATCVQGHHLCYECKSLFFLESKKCPTCGCDFGNCRNYVAEKLCVKFSDIKSSLLDPRHVSNRRVLKNRKTVSVQTDNVSISSKKECVSCSVQTEEFTDKTILPKTNCPEEMNGQKQNLNKSDIMIEAKN